MTKKQKEKQAPNGSAGLAWLVLIVGLFFVGSSVRSQSPVHGLSSGEDNSPHFFLDWCEFRSDSAGMTRLEVYYKITNAALTFRSVDTGYAASYDLNVAVSRKGMDVDTRYIHRDLFVQEYRRTSQRTDFVLNMLEFELDPGKYKITAILTDREGDRSSTQEKTAKLSDFKPNKRPKLSSIQFLRSATVMPDSQGYFRKGNYELIPSVDRIARGGEGGEPLVFYYEVYAGKDKTFNALIDTRIKSRKGELVYRDTVFSLLDKPIKRQIREVSVSQFDPAEYEVTVSVSTGKGKPLASRSSKMHITWSLLEMARNDYETLVDQLEYIATSNELHRLKKAESVSDRIAAWKAFWKGRDPTPGTRENEAKVAFYLRIRYVNGAFSTSRRDGWRTDQGMIYMKYGPPDEAVDEPMSPSSGAFQIWYYYNIKGERRRFVFVDEFGDEDFRLQYPYDGRYR